MTLYDAQGNFIVGAQLPLSTRNGRQIPNERRQQRPPPAMKVAREIVLAHHRTARLRSLSSMYNCVGMAFATRRTWIEPEHLRMILEDDDYRQVPRESELMPGDIVVYRDEGRAVVHVGVVIQVQTDLSEGTLEIFVLSQWGADGEYFHRIDDVNPRLGKPAEYWTDRV